MFAILSLQIRKEYTKGQDISCTSSARDFHSAIPNQAFYCLDLELIIYLLNELCFAFVWD